MKTEEINLAPVRELQEIARPDPPSGESLNEYLDHVIKDFSGTFTNVRRELHAAWEYVGHMMEGRQKLRRAHRGTGWRVYGKATSTKAEVETLPVLDFYVRDNLARWVNLKIPCEVTAADDSEEAEATAKAGDHILAYCAAGVYTQRFIQEECMLGQSTGNYARYAYWDPQMDQQTIKVPVTEQRSVKWFPDAFLCASCGREGTTDQLGARDQGLEEDFATEGTESTEQQEPNVVDKADAGMTSSPDGSTSETSVPSVANSSAPDSSEPMTGVCPDCGSELIEYFRVPTTEMEVVVGHEERPAGGVRGEQVPFFELLFDYRVPLETSLFLNRERRLRVEVIKAAYPNLQLERDDPQSTGLRAQRRLQYSTPFSVGLAISETADNCVTFSQWWLDPAVYANFVFQADEETVSGEKFLKGEKLVDRCPDGIYLAIVPGHDRILDLRNEHHRDRWVSAPWFIKAMSGVGLSIFPTAESQRIFNMLVAQAFQQIRTMTTPGGIYDKDIVSEEDAKRLGLPGIYVPANGSKLDTGRNMRDALLELTGKPLPAHFQWFMEQARGQIQSGTGSVQFNTQLTGQKSRTATGDELGNSLANLQDDPQHLMRQDADERFGMIMLNLFQQHAVDARWIPGMHEHKKVEGAYFRGADLKSKLVVKAVPGSHRGRSDYDQRMAFQEAANALAVFGGIEMAPPEIVTQISEQYGVRFAHLFYNDQQRLDRQRINQLKRMLPDAMDLASQYPQQRIGMDPATGQVGVQPVDVVTEVAARMLSMVKPEVIPEEPGHEYAIQFLRRWFLSDEAIDGHPLLRASVRLLIKAHEMCIIEVGQEQEAVAAASNPMAAGAQGASAGQAGATSANNKPVTRQQQRRVSAGRQAA